MTDLIIADDFAGAPGTAGWHVSGVPGEGARARLGIPTTSPEG